ncbi:uncharacterized protein K460DRAFT_363866 [Cucurbitaria berberidis CBS 394.84]|uniref:Uncharacterized protein n=1 Tax=Cucurbitaria berberidis CBS 394.84 TaxID=1168544 RepID=A0A9P4GLL8_9PLEO|nr:uncharacterized protein K460DRAFT_363866 [Cucurbitaria berberidis CBS 394.84]KAF1847845.1 hypothetical protein K460DRAFT_363866 [Cucurbitaria berberidis CBS 394.84]
MAPCSTGSLVSYTTSVPSSTSMASVSVCQSTHPFLTPGRASSIASWTSSLPERSCRSTTSSEADLRSRDTIEAYRQLKMAIFSKAGTANAPKPG